MAAILIVTVVTVVSGLTSTNASVNKSVTRFENKAECIASIAVIDRTEQRSHVQRKMLEDGTRLSFLVEKSFGTAKFAESHVYECEEI